MDFDVIVVGGGLAGTSLGVALRRSNLKVAVVEARAPVKPQGWDPRIYAISPANVQFLDEAGVWGRLDASRLTPVAEMAVFGDTNGALRFTAYDAGLSELAWTAESSLLHLELWETLKRQHNVMLLCPAAPAELVFAPSAAVLTLADGRRLRGRLIVGADGIDSWVRQQAGILARWLPYGETAVVANFRCEKPHRNIAYQWFRKDGVLAYLPLPQDRMSIVWSAPQTFAQELLALEADAFCSTVALAGSGTLGTLVLDTAPAGFDLRLMRVAEVVGQRVALIGDAAHAIHPLSGHGINLGFQDARALAARLEMLPDWRDPGDPLLLRSYARARAEESLLVQYTTHALNRFFRSRNPLVALLRNSGLNLTARLPVVKDALVRYAANGPFH